MQCESFRVEDDHLIRSVVPARGTPYEHRCRRSVFERVTWQIDELRGELFTLESLVAKSRLSPGGWMPFSQAATALAFLKERGLVETRYRKNYATTDSMHLNGMTEYHALREKGSSDPTGVE